MVSSLTMDNVNDDHDVNQSLPYVHEIADVKDIGLTEKAMSKLGRVGMDLRTSAAAPGWRLVQLRATF
jgi:hypothetical protein